MIHQKKTGVTVRPRLLNPGKAIVMAICPIICSFYYLARALMHDVACGFACAVGCAETILARTSLRKTFSRCRVRFYRQTNSKHTEDRVFSSLLPFCEFYCGTETKFKPAELLETPGKSYDSLELAFLYPDIKIRTTYTSYDRAMGGYRWLMSSWRKNFVFFLCEFKRSGFVIKIPSCSC